VAGDVDDRVERAVRPGDGPELTIAADVAGHQVMWWPVVSWRMFRGVVPRERFALNGHGLRPQPSTAQPPKNPPSAEEPNMPRTALTSDHATAGGVSDRVDHAHETNELFREYHVSGGRDVRDRLVLEHMPIADRCARRYVRRGEPLADLVQVARMALVGAVERFDPERGSTFEAFAIPTVLGELRHHFRDNCWAISVPRRAKDMRSRVQRARDELSQQLGREPSFGEIAEVLEIDEDVVVTTIDSNRCYRTEPLAPSGDEFGVVGVRGSAEQDDPCADDATDRVRATASIRQLDRRLRRVVVWRFYEGLTQREIGDRLGVGQVQVSRLLSKALGQLRGSPGVATTG
jgi:RNA polymerase sigma-B factor